MLKISIDGNDVEVAKHLLNFSYNDCTAEEVDSIEFSYINLYQVKIASHIKASITIGNANMEFGSFEVASIDHDLVSNIYKLSANQVTGWQTSYSRAFEKTTIQAIVNQLAGEMGLQAKVNDKRAVDYLAQSNQSNYAVLSDLALKYHSYFNIKSGQLVFSQVEPTTSADYSFKLADFNSFSLKKEAKQAYQSIKMLVPNTKDNTTKELVAGSGEPQKTMQLSPMADGEAMKYGEAQLAKLNAGSLSGSFSLPGRIIYAGTSFKLEDSLYKDRLFTINKLTHTINMNWQISGDFSAN